MNPKKELQWSLWVKAGAINPGSIIIFNMQTSLRGLGAKWLKKPCREKCSVSEGSRKRTSADFGEDTHLNPNLYALG